MPEKVIFDAVLAHGSDAAFRKEEDENGFRFTICPNTETKTESVTAYLPFEFKKDDRLFLNGYQSWTQSREYGVRDFDRSMRFCPKFLDKKFEFSAYGDGGFYKKEYRKGVLHGYSYAYIRRGDEYFFFGSLAENTGFTRIIFNTVFNRVIFQKDCAGRVTATEYKVFDIFFARGREKEVFDAWFEKLGITPRSVTKKNGYTSWYDRYQDISQSVIENALRGFDRLDKTPDIFQIDDGFETKVGDWLRIDKTKFPNGLEPIVKAIKAKGCEAGIWLAPFVCQKDSALAKDHPDWLLRDKNGKPVGCGSNWGGAWALDFYNDGVREYLRECFAFYKTLGFGLFKLDFLYAVCMIPRPDKTRGEIMFEAADFLRELCGNREILACGVPLLPVFGKVEYCRIGMDMSLSWDDKPYMRLFHSERPSTKNTVLNTVFRRQLSGRAFLNDPDVFLLRDRNTALSPEQKSTLATANALFGGLLFVSDDFSEYSEKQLAEYKTVLALSGRAENISVSPAAVPTVTYTLDGEQKTLKLG